MPPCSPDLCAAAASDGARIVKYSREDIVPVHAKLRFSTLIVLPDEEEILDFTTGDREFWIINGSHNLCYIHPAQAGIRSNLNLITASGHVYSFLLTEISGDSSLEPDLKLFVEPKEGSASTNLLRGYVRAADAEAYKKELETVYNQASEQVRAAQAHAAEEVNQFRSAYATKLRFDYKLDAKFSHEPFLVSAIYHDETFTYVRCAAREKPALYEMKDGKPNLVPFQVENGVYIVPKIVDAGYLAVGKKRLNFHAASRREVREGTWVPFRRFRTKHRSLPACFRRMCSRGCSSAWLSSWCSSCGSREARSPPHLPVPFRLCPRCRLPLKSTKPRSWNCRTGFKNSSASRFWRRTLSRNNLDRLRVKREQQALSPGGNSGAARPERAGDSIQAERKKRDYLSLFASNVALSYRKNPETPRPRDE